MGTVTSLLRFLLFFLLSSWTTFAALPDAEIHAGGASFLATFGSFGAHQDVTGILQNPPSTVDSRLCNETIDYSSLSWSGDIMLIPRGNCTFERKAYNAQQMGASAVIIYNTLESRYKFNATTETVIYPTNKLDYECNNGESNITDLLLDPPAYNGTYHDAFLSFDSNENECIVQNPALCESRRCLVTGPADNTTGVLKACCAWDISLSMDADADFPKEVDIVAVFITMRQADDFLAFATDDSTISIQERPTGAFNFSSVLLWGLAIFIVAFASWYSSRDYRIVKREWQRRFQRSMAQHLQQQQREQQQREATAPAVPAEGEEIREEMGDEAVDLAGISCEESESQPVDSSREHEGEEATPDQANVDIESPPPTTQDVSSQDAVASTTETESPSEPPQQPVEQENDQSPPSQPRRNTSHQQALELNAWHAAAFVIVASSLLLILFYFEIYAWVTVLYGIGCSGAMAQLIFAPSYHWIGRRSKLLSSCCFAKVTKVTCCELNTIQWVYVFASVSGYLIGAMWLYVGFTNDEPSINPFFWIVQDVMGASVSILFLSVIRLSSIKVATILLTATFLYDIFFVFITPYIFNGNSVMVTVATGGGAPEASADYCEKYPDDARCEGGNPLPLLFTFPRINDYRGGSSLLGLGDVVIPGLLIAFASRLDDARRLVGGLTDMNVNMPKHWYNGYLFPLVIAYAVGLAAAQVAVVLMERGQPALLYIVPCCLGTVFVTGRHELGKLWRGPTVIQTADRILSLDPNASALRVTRMPDDATDVETDSEGEEGPAGAAVTGSIRSIS